MRQENEGAGKPAVAVRYLVTPKKASQKAASVKVLKKVADRELSEPASCQPDQGITRENR